jgi:uncharacterized surface protein with fasciclin (FAS1) repeats
LENTPEAIANLKGDKAKAEFVNIFKQVQRLKTQLDQHTNLSETETQDIEQTMPADTQQAFKVMYLETAKQLQQKISANCCVASLSLLMVSDADSTSQISLDCSLLEAIANLKGDKAKAEFVNIFKQVQRLKTQLDQHTNLSEIETQDIEQTMPADTQQAFKVMYLETAKQLFALGCAGGLVRLRLLYCVYV